MALGDCMFGTHCGRWWALALATATVAACNPNCLNLDFGNGGGGSSCAGGNVFLLPTCGAVLNDARPLDDGNSGSDGGATRRYELLGQGTPGDTILLFRDSCSTVSEATTVVDGAGAFSFVVDVGANSNEHFYVGVPDGDGGMSSCCGSGRLTHRAFDVDSEAPTGPTNLVWRPEASTGCGQIIVGQTESRARVALYSDSECLQLVELCNAEDPFRAGFDGEFAVYTNLADAGPETRFFARVTDSSGNVGACGGPAEYVGGDAGVPADAGASDGGM